MYQDWMDGVPLLFNGCYENNIAQAQKAVDYYEINEKKEQADSWRNYIQDEIQKQKEYESLSIFAKIKRYFSER